MQRKDIPYPISGSIIKRSHLINSASLCRIARWGWLLQPTLPVYWQNLPKGLSRPQKKPYAETSYTAPEEMYTKDLEWDKDTTHTEDLDTYLPLNRLQELQKSGLFGSVSCRFYGVPTTYSQRQTRELDAQTILKWCKEDGVDIAILVPL